MQVVFFFYHLLKSAFLKHKCYKTSKETCILFIVLWDHGFHCGTLKLLEGH